jgi:hydrogenase/urease accessory protein HupE
LQPDYLELTLQGPDRWSVLWRVPDIGGRPMPITAVLPDACTPATAPEPRFDGAAWSSAWLADCPGGLQGGDILIRGLEATQTDVLARYEIRPGTVETRRLTASEPGFTIPAPQGIRGIAATYGPLGVSHILAGADHLLFVFALLLLVRDPWRLVGTVTAFTLAHSLSLAAATLGWIVVPAPPVEAVVALSIMFLAAELVKAEGTGLRLTERYPWIVAFAFGLLHGLGFASALREIGLPEGDVALALLFFNLGVEAGQLLFIVFVLLAGALLARLYPRIIASISNRGRPGARIVGYAIGSLSAAWLVARVAAF